VIVVDLGDVLVWCGSDDAAGALDEQTVVGDRPGEEKGIEGWGVEAFADERRGADDQQSVTGFGCVQSFDNRPTIGGTHRSLEHERLMSPCGEHCGKSLDVGDPSGEDQTIAATRQGRGNVIGDQSVSWLVEGQSPVHLG
jgi:hypothetical protein